MSARSRKAAPKTAKSKPVTSTPQTAPKLERSASPLNISRQEEKDELIHLNDRLASYIDYVRQLENDKERLTKRVQTITEEKLDNGEAIRKTYEKEMTALRALVDDLASKRAQLEIEADSSRQSALEAKSALRSLENENNSLKKRMDTLKKDFDDQILARTDLENRVTSLNEELDFQKRLWAEERSSLVSQTTVIEEQISTKKAAEYESRLAEELAEIRARTAEELESYRIELEAAFEARFDQIKSTYDNQSSESGKLRDELKAQRKRIEDLNKELAQKTSDADLYKRRCNDLNQQLDDERRDFELQINMLKSEVDKLNSDLRDRMQEYTDLLHTKVSLDQEILVYRKMIEGEEQRLNIPTPQRTSSFSGQRGKKRRLDFDDALDDTSLSGASFVGRRRAQFAYKVTANAIGEVEFDSVQNGTGKWVRLVNNTSKADSVDIANWKLIHSADGVETEFKFPGQSKIKKGSSCCIWSNDCESIKHNPPHDLVMDKHFAAGTNISIRLLDASGKEQASCSVTKQRVAAPYSRYSSRQDEKCCIQ